MAVALRRKPKHYTKKTKDIITPRTRVTGSLPNPQEGPQTAFLETNADIAIYGGAAGGGKTTGLLLDFARPEFLANPLYKGVIFRRTCPMITNEGGIWDASMQYYTSIGGEPIEGRLEWRFPSGATIRFTHLQHEKNKTDWQSAEIPRLGFDEITHFSETQFFYMLTRARCTIGIKPVVRACCNPDPDSWLAKFLDWWLDKDGWAIKERSGILRWFVRENGKLIWADSKEELKGIDEDYEPKSVTFIPSKLQDNKILMEKDPSYLANLKAQHSAVRLQLLDGNWKAREGGGKYISRSSIEIVDRIPYGSHPTVRAWDLAATEQEMKTTSKKDPDWTVGVKMALIRGIYYVIHVERFRANPAKVQEKIKNTAKQDGTKVKIYIPQDPGQAGKDQVQNKKKDLDKFEVKSNIIKGSKLIRGYNFALDCENGLVKILKGTWNDDYLKVLDDLPDGKHDDDFDASVDAHRMLQEKFITLSDEKGKPLVNPMGSRIPAEVIRKVFK